MDGVGVVKDGRGPSQAVRAWSELIFCFAISIAVWATWDEGAKLDMEYKEEERFTGAGGAMVDGWWVYVKRVVAGVEVAVVGTSLLGRRWGYRRGVVCFV